jgi:hypothetical protein
VLVCLHVKGQGSVGRDSLFKGGLRVIVMFGFKLRPFLGGYCGGCSRCCGSILAQLWIETSCPGRVLHSRGSGAVPTHNVQVAQEVRRPRGPKTMSSQKMPNCQGVMCMLVPFMVVCMDSMPAHSTRSTPGVGLALLLAA